MRLLRAAISASRSRAFRDTGFSSRYWSRRAPSSCAVRICVRFRTASSSAGLTANALSHKLPASASRGPGARGGSPGSQVPRSLGVVARVPIHIAAAARRVRLQHGQAKPVQANPVVCAQQVFPSPLVSEFCVARPRARSSAGPRNGSSALPAAPARPWGSRNAVIRHYPMIRVHCPGAGHMARHAALFLTMADLMAAEVRAYCDLSALLCGSWQVRTIASHPMRACTRSAFST